MSKTVFGPGEISILVDGKRVIIGTFKEFKFDFPVDKKKVYIAGKTVTGPRKHRGLAP